MALDSKGFEALLDKNQALQLDYGQFLISFLKRVGMRALAQTVQLTPVDTGNLKINWKLSDVFVEGKTLSIVMYNQVEYASFIEDGHAQHRRWVPGTWVGGRFVYDPKAETGMMLKEKFIPGYHMAKISIDKVLLEMPARYLREFEAYVRRVEK